MFPLLKQSGRVVCFVNFLLPKNQKFINAIRPYSYSVNYTSGIRLCSVGQSKSFLISNDQSRLIQSRNKHTKKKRQRKPQDEESSDEEDEEVDVDDEFSEENADVKTYNLKSLRIDGILKTVLRISRSTVEQAFYQNKIRINGKIVQKKSQNGKENDELDLIKGFAADYSHSLIVGRVKILKIESDPDTGVILLKAWKSKSLRIDNYQDTNAWREPEEE